VSVLIVSHQNILDSVDSDELGHDQIALCLNCFKTIRDKTVDVVHVALIVALYPLCRCVSLLICLPANIKHKMNDETWDGWSAMMALHGKAHTQCHTIDSSWCDSSTPLVTAKPPASIFPVMFISYDTAWPLWDLQTESSRRFLRGVAAPLSCIHTEAWREPVWKLSFLQSPQWFRAVDKAVRLLRKVIKAFMARIMLYVGIIIQTDSRLSWKGKQMLG